MSTKVNFLEELLNSQDSVKWIASIENITDNYLISVFENGSLSESYRRQVQNELFDLALLRRLFTRVWIGEMVEELREIPIELLTNKPTLHNLIRPLQSSKEGSYFGSGK